MNEFELARWSVLLASAGLGFAIVSAVLAGLANALSKGKIQLDPKDPIGRFFAYGILIGGGAIGFAIIGLFVAGCWWLLMWLSHTLFGGERLTPGRLAMLSLAIGPLPLLGPLAASVITRLVGGDVSAAGTTNCKVFGVEIGGLVYSLFMMYFLCFFTFGLMFLGLMASGIWALFA